MALQKTGSKPIWLMDTWLRQSLRPEAFRTKEKIFTKNFILFLPFPPSSFLKNMLLRRQNEQKESLFPLYFPVSFPAFPHLRMVHKMQ